MVSRLPHSDDSRRWALRRGFTIVELLTVILILGVLIALLLPALQMSRETMRRTHCASNLRQIGLAVIQYEMIYGQQRVF